jgi:hypothetical protein
MMMNILKQLKIEKIRNLFTLELHHKDRNHKNSLISNLELF